MKQVYVSGLEPNENVTTQFLVVNKEIRQKKTGEPYLSLVLADRTGEIDAKMWDNVAEVMETFEKDDFIKVKGIAQVYQNRQQFTIHRLRLMDDSEADFADYFPASKRDPEEMFGELRQIIQGVGNEHLRALLSAMFDDQRIAELYKNAPAAKSIHHACRGGLIEHVLSLCTLCRMMAQHYGYVDLDLLLTGAILHDIGKIEELNFDRSFSYSTPGQLLGHIVIGLRMIGDKLHGLPDFPPKLRMLVEHMVISHHGELEFGSPKMPLFLEALLLHHLDNLDSKMETMRAAAERDKLVEGEFTSWVSSLERAVLKKDKFLVSESTQAVVPKQPAAPIAASDEWKQTDSEHEAQVKTELKPVGPQTTLTNAERSEPAKQSGKPEKVSDFGSKLQAVLDLKK
jgi:3'-5' exoribonuclease